MKTSNIFSAGLIYTIRLGHTRLYRIDLFETVTLADNLVAIVHHVGGYNDLL